MENIDIKKVIIFLFIVLILIIGIFFAVNKIASGNKNYTLEKINEEEYKYFAVYTEGKYGVLNEKGEMIVQNIYEDIIVPNPTKAVFIGKKGDKDYETLNASGEKIFEKYKNVQAIEINENNTTCPYEKSVLKYEENGKYGLINFEGKAITKPIYEELTSIKYKEGEILAKKNGKYGVINNKGKVLIPFEYSGIEADKYYKNTNEQTGYITKSETKEGIRYGYINSKWKKMLKPEYTAISRILDIDSSDIYLIASKNRTIRTSKKQRKTNRLFISRIIL